MNIDEIIKLAKLENKTLFKALFVSLFLFFVFAPGCALLILEGKSELFNSQLTVTLGTGLLISAPFIFLGVVVYMHPYKTLCEFRHKSATEAAWNLLIGAGIWSLLSAGVSFSFIHTANEWLMLNVSENILIQYGAVWFVLFSVFGGIFYINSSREIKS
ncbi:hypothetical protein [Shewanella aestuarii]|uniref:Uncharacterized protein n=1 Tax=Shewanella aestuarii TaxID=1028752 RepID=A0A6G9QJD4_9GAMM|nr:hypothetical protein [Shewanella aestuarii]QIR14582.1 hypothetical protein HBH39_08855 [Shewanella aestuarii]